MATDALLAPSPLVVPERPAPYVLPPVDGWTTAGVPSPDPLLDRSGSALPGLFFNVETNVLAVHFRNQLHIGVPVGPNQTAVVNFYGPGLDDTVSPRVTNGGRIAFGKPE